jgi:mono/diheme cytochrome c family protein
MRALIVVGLLAAAFAARADEKQIKLKEGPGQDLVKANCVMCHSLDYIQMNSPFMDRKGWEASVNKMIKAFDARVKPEDVPKIVDYLAKAYGKPEPSVAK